MTINKKILFIIFCFSFLVILKVFSEEYTNKNIGYSVNLPYKWEKINSTNSEIDSFSNKDGSAIFQVYYFKGNSFKKSEKILEYFKKKLKTTGNIESFMFSGNDSVLADFNFKSDFFNARGYFIFINGKKYDFALLSYSNIQNYEENHDFLLSILNSFSPDEESKKIPGPVSQYYYQDDLKNKKRVKLLIWGKTIETIIDYNEIETTKVLIEREARILAFVAKKQLAQKDVIKPWSRYYNLIYRDNYSRIQSLSSKIINSLDIENSSSDEIVKKLVFFIQNFKFTRSGTLADLTSPLASLYSFTGDCDSRALLLLIMLHQIGIDAILLVSIKYHHAALGINMRGSGARMKFEGKSYLFVELTKVVEIGQVLKKTSDLSAWIPMKIGY